MICLDREASGPSLTFPLAGAPAPHASVPGIGAASSFTHTPSPPPAACRRFRIYGGRDAEVLRLLQLVERHQPAPGRACGENDLGIARERGLLLLRASVGIADIDPETRLSLYPELVHPLRHVSGSIDRKSTRLN